MPNNKKKEERRSDITKELVYNYCEFCLTKLSPNWKKCNKDRCNYLWDRKRYVAKKYPDKIMTRTGVIVDKIVIPSCNLK